MAVILGVAVSNRAIALSMIHNSVEIVGMVGWLSLTLNHNVVAGVIVLVVTLTVEHVLALAAGKVA